MPSPRRLDLHILLRREVDDHALHGRDFHLGRNGLHLRRAARGYGGERIFLRGRVRSAARRIDVALLDLGDVQ